MKKFFQLYHQISLVKKIVFGMLLGTLLALLIPQVTAISVLGTLFVGALKSVAPILVFFLVIEALSRQAVGQKTNIKNIIILYLIGTFLAGFTAIIASYLFPLTIKLAKSATDIAPPQGVSEVLNNLLLNLVDNPVNALLNANYIGILAWSVLLGIALRNASSGTKTLLADTSQAIAFVVRVIISFAPFGVTGLVFEAVSKNGVEIFTDYGKLIALLLGCMIFVALVINPIIVFLNIRQNPYPLIFTCLKESGITAFFTRSSAANIPVNMKLCKDLQLDEDNYSVSIPLGATINMAGAAITISILALAAVHTLGITVDFPTALMLSILSAVCACGTSGVAGGSILLIPLACSLFGIPNDISAQVIGVGYIIGVIQDSAETGLNSSTDVLFTATAEYRQWKKEGREVNFRKILGR